MKRGKKYVEAAKKIDRTVQYDTADAISLVKSNATAKFDETIEVHIRTGCDGRHAEQQIRGAVVLPHGTGKTDVYKRQSICDGVSTRKPKERSGICADADEQRSGDYVSTHYTGMV